MQKIKNILKKLKDNKQLAMTICGVFLLLLLCGGVTFAIFNFSNNANNNGIDSGYISFVYTEPSNEYVVENALPTKDGEAMGLTNYFEFSVTTTAKTNNNDDNGVTLPYEITITESEGNTLTSDQIKMYLTEVEGEKEVVNTNPTLVSNLEPSLYKNIGTKVGFNLHLHRNGNETVTTKFRLRAWIDYDVDVSDWDAAGEFVYKFRVNVNGEATYQGYETEQSCFAYEKYDNNGNEEYQITGYDFNKCDGKNIVVPTYIDEVITFKEIVAINWISDDEFLEIYKNWMISDGYCDDYGTIEDEEDWQGCLTLNSTTETEFYAEVFSAYEGLKSNFNILIGRNYYDCVDEIEDLNHYASMGLCTIEYGEEIIVTNSIKVSKINSFTNTVVASVNNDKDVYSINNLNNIMGNKKSNVSTMADVTPIINGLIVPEGVVITNNAFSSIEIEKLVDRKGSFPTSCFVYTSDGSAVTITRYNCKGVLNLRISSNIDNLPVTSIGEISFSGNKLESVDIPNSVIKIGRSAFASNNLKEIDIPNSVTTINDSAFSWNQLVDIKISDNITRIEQFVFSKNQLSTIIIPDNVTYIGSQAFSFNNLTSVNIPKSVTTIDDNAFISNALESVIINDADVSINEQAFSNNNIVDLDLGNGNVSIGTKAFEYNNIKKVVFPDNVTFIGGFAFYENPLSSIVMSNASGLLNYRVFDPNSIYSAKDKDGNFPSECFKYTSDGTSITIDGYYCTGVVSIDIPEEIDGLPVKEVRGLGSENLVNLTIPDNGLTIESYIISSNNLKSVVLHDTTILIDRITNEKVKITNKNGNYSKACFGFATFDTYARVTGLRCPAPDNLVIPDEYNNLPVTEVTSFSNEKLNSVIIPDTVTTIYDKAFENSNISKLVLSSNIKQIGLYAFKNNNISGAIELPDGMLSIGQEAFANNKIVKVRVPGNVKSFGSEVFMDNNISNVSFSSGVSYIPDEIFVDNNIEKITIPNTITSIGVRAFKDNNIDHLKLPDSVITIQDGAFYNNNIESIKWSENLTSIGTSSFSNNKLTEVGFPVGLTTIGSYAFKNNNLLNVDIPENVTTIGVGAFYKDANSNSSLNKIINKTKNIFDWNLIVNAESGSNVVTGTVINDYGNVEIVAE